MKKFIAIALAAFSMTCAASVQTNWVYVVSNIYNNVYSESVITQKVKNTHFNYYYTNHIYTVSNIVVEVSRTNLHLNVVWDNFGPWVNAASNSALQAAASVSNAQDYAGSAAQYATTAGNSASLANGAVSLAQAYASQSESAAANGLAAINSRIAWFDEWASNKVITVVHTNISILVNAQDYSYIYTNTAGTAFNYVRVHPYGANGGATISARGAMAYSTIGIRAWPLPRVSGYWDFYPAYIDTDENGMRLQYVPDTTIPIQYGDSSSAYPNGKTVPATTVYAQLEAGPYAHAAKAGALGLASPHTQAGEVARGAASRVPPLQIRHGTGRYTVRRRERYQSMERPVSRQTDKS